MFNKMSGTTPDLTESNIEKLKQLFPEIITDGKIDFKKLEILLGKEIDDSPERYNFTWNGKKETMQFAQQPSKGTLRPIKEKSKHWDTTENVYIEGDNLEVLKLLQKSYNNKVKMIYIDPPYNTGNEFVYKDDFKNGVDSYLELTGQKTSEGIKFSSNTESNGRYHTDWLNMMYARLKLSRNLLSKDGLIFISIDDNEIDNMKKISSEIFGENNFINCFIWNCSTAGGIRPKFASKTHEYILCYAKNIKEVSQFDAPLSNDAVKQYNKEDLRGKYREKDFIFKNTSTNINQKYLITCPDGQKVKPKPGYIYRFVKDTFDKHLNDDMVVFKKTTTGPLVDENDEQAHWNIYIKKHLGDSTGAPSTLIPKEMVNLYNVGTQDVQKLFNGKRVFENSKPINLVNYFINLATDNNSIILDFFSGSATTAHAVIKANVQDGGNRKFIMVQLPETLEEKTEAYKDGYRTICDIGEERIRRAGEKIRDELLDKKKSEGMLSEGHANLDELDIGFKVFSLDTSNLNEWQSNFEDIELNIDLLENNFVDGRSEEDVLYEIILKNGLDLTYPINEIISGESKIYDVAFGNLFVCLNDKINRNVAHKIATLREEYGIETSQVVFKDSGFENDTEKLNCYEILKAAGYQEADLLSI